MLYCNGRACIYQKFIKLKKTFILQESIIFLIWNLGIMNDTPKIIGKVFLHSCYIRNKGDDGVCVSELHYYDNGEIKPALNLIKNPKRKIYITKKKFRNYDLKKERESIDHLDCHTIYNKDMTRKVFEYLNGFKPKGYVDRSILDSPYVYGGNASIEYLIKRKYYNDFEKTKLPIKGITTGCLDTEFSLLPESFNELICLTTTHENKVFTSINIKFFKQYHDDTKNYTDCDMDDLVKESRDILVPLIEEMFNEHPALSRIKNRLPFEFHYYLGCDELDILKWSFRKIHENKTSFINIWNMGYDIGMILSVLKKYDCDPKELFCSPEIPDEWKSVFYKKDRRVASHVTDIWNWLNATSYTQFYDTMSVYAKLRTVNGKESSYALDYILKINGLEGKLKFKVDKSITPGTPDWHRYMVKYEILKYIIYNQADSVWLQLLMWVTNDTTNFFSLSGLTPIEKTFKQTVYVHDSFYNAWEPKGYIMGTNLNYSNDNSDISSDDEDEEKSKGGAVLSPYLMQSGIGVNVLDTSPETVTSIVSYVNDEDFSQQYPRTVIMGNISNENKLYTVTSIDGDPERVESFFSLYANLEDNSVRIAKDFFKLPGFEEMRNMVNKKLKS